ncbi:MAG: hypothetical protein R6W67_09570 [Bacteroidales bacterium]
MKRSLYKLVLAAVLMNIAAAATTAQEVNKKYSKVFSVDPATAVVISNRYGDVTVENWDKNEVSIDVVVTAEMSTPDRSERVLEMINVEFMENDTAVGATTIIDSRFSSITRGSGTNRFKIDYTIRMPGKNNLNIANRYGNIKIDEHPGWVNIDLRYGNLVALRLTRGNVKPINCIAISYGKATLDEANWLSVITRYTTDLSIRKVQAMMLDSRYSKIIIDEAGSLVADSKYDNISVKNINNFVAEAAYTSMKLGTLSSSLNLAAKYGSFEAATVPPGFERLTVDASYCGITLGIDKNAAYKLEAKVNYGSISYCEDCIDIQRRIVESTSREIVGIAQPDKSPSATVTIKSSYASVRLR